MVQKQPLVKLWFDLYIYIQDDIIKDIFFNIKINILNRFRLHDLTYQTHNLDHKLYWV